VTSVLFGVAPARHAVASLLQKTLQETGARAAGLSSGQSKTGGFWVAGEIALAFVLLIGAGLMLRTLANLLRQDPGFRTENLLSLDLYRPVLESEEEREKDAQAQAEQIRDIVERVGHLPGVEAAVAANYGLLDGTIFVHGGLHVEGLTSVGRDAGFAVRARYVSPKYFTGLGQALLRGRPFSDTDRIGSPSVAIVNAKMARMYWGTLDVLGKRFSSSTDEKGRESWSEIVGVVADVREFLVRDEAVPEYYLPLYQGGVRGASLLVRTGGRPEASAGMVTKQIWSAYPDLPVTNVTSIRTTIGKSVGNEKLHTVLLGMFAGTGLLMALVGTYGVIAYAVERRTQEIGVRIALGASREHVLLLVFRPVLLPVLAGLAIGTPAAFMAETAIRSELYGVRSTDPATFGSAALSIVLVAGIACWIPARRALKVDPILALRCE
jgi:putative ABC transport system permease protein